MSSQSKLILALGAVLALAVVLSGIAFFALAPSDDAADIVNLVTPSQAASAPAMPQFDVAPAPDGSIQGFDLSLFSSSAYQYLNTKFVQDGSLPVRPPAAAGKANPFL